MRHKIQKALREHRLNREKGSSVFSHFKIFLGCWERMYLSFGAYWYALDFMLEWCLFSTEHSRKESCVLGGGLLHFPGMFLHQLQEKHEGNQLPGEYFCL